MPPFRSVTLPILVLPVSSTLTVLSPRAKQDFAISLLFLFPESQGTRTHAPWFFPHLTGLHFYALKNPYGWKNLLM